ncbi:MAG: rhodanese [Alteromonas sp.]|nr:rhodanese [Alteromonas sp.]MAY23860.1 rhodanese [Flavobacteriaceae bacterium]
MSFFTSLFGAAQETDTIKILAKEAFKTAIEKDSVQLVDVRTPQEYQAGYIKDAINIDYFDQATFQQEFDKLDKNEPVYIYCRSGNRSQKAAARLDSLGFKKIYDLRGGYLGW